MPFTSLLPQEQEEITISPPRRSQIQKRPRSPSSTINRTFIQSPPIYTNTIPMKKTTGNSSTKRKRIAILWFRKDLRLHDNLAIEEALKKYRQEEKENKKMLLIPIYIIHKPKLKRCGAVRFQFLIESIEDLSKQLISKQNQLIVLRGDALEVFKIILPAWKVTDLFFDEYILPYAIKKDQEIIQLAQNKYQIQVHTTKGFLLYNPHEILQKNQGKVPLDFDLFCKLLSEMEQPSLPLPTPIQINGYLEKETSPQRLYELLYEYHGYQYGDVIDKIAFGCRHRSEEDLKNILKPFSVPKNVKEFELEPPIVHSFIYGGETKALEALTNFCNCEERVGLFDKPRTCPVFIPHENPSTTCLSPFLAFGCLSCREFFYRIMFIELRYPNIVKGPPSVTLDGQLLWREFFYCFSIHTPFFDCQKKNIHCLQINWRLLELPDLKNNDDQETQSQKQQQQQQALAMEHYTCWMEGRTGFPWIDAIMKQILQEGWAHHLARYAVF
jgi:cryptochrome